MTGFKRLLLDLAPIPQPLSISLPNGGHVTVTHTGAVQLSNNILLQKVRYIPAFTCNLLSISKLTTSSTIYITIDHASWALYDKTYNQILATGSVLNGLYILNFSSPVDTHAQTNTTSNVWH